MKKIAALFSVLVAVCVSPFAAACTPAATAKVEEEYDMTAPAVFSADSERTAVNPLIYGQFIEHIETCIYDGIWSELVLDRKFYYEVGRSVALEILGRRYKRRVKHAFGRTLRRAVGGRGDLSGKAFVYAQALRRIFLVRHGRRL